MPETPNPSEHQTYHSTQKGSGLPPLQFDVEEFRPFLKGMNFTLEQETELLESIWFIVCACAEIGYKGDPVSLIFGELTNDAALNSKNSEEAK